MDSRTIFGILGNLTAFITLLFPVRSLIQIRRGRIARSPDLFAAEWYQYHAAIINCLLWVLYRDAFLKAANTVGVMMGFIYLTLFILFTQGFIQWLKHSGIVILELIGVYHLGLLAFNFDDPIMFVGVVCTTGSVYLSVVKLVHDETSRPLIFETVASFVNGLIWTIYAIFSSDKFILVANLAGGIFGVVKHVQYVKQQRQRKIVAEEMRQRQIAEEMTRSEPNLAVFSKLDSIV